MNMRGLLLLLSGLVITLGLYEGGVIAHEKTRRHSGQSRQLLHLKRKINRLRQNLISDELSRTKTSLGVAPECWAKSDSEARQKLLEIVERQERQVMSGGHDTNTSELEQYPEQMSSVLCEDGVPEKERLAIAAELSSRHTWGLHISRFREPKDAESYHEKQHQVIKKHLGMQRYIDQVMKCRKSDLAQAVRQRALAQEHLGAMLGLSNEQKPLVQELLAKWHALRFGVDEHVSVLDDTGHMVDVGIQESGDVVTHGDVLPDSGAERARRELELRESFYSLLTPEQAQRYKRLLEDQGDSIVFLRMNSFEAPETLRAQGQQDAGASNMQEASN